jgi:DMSO/TMAO reductase YedYZ heme-binding membrane subunit
MVLAITPLRDITATPALLRFRRSLGVGAFILRQLAHALLRLV